jgi:hypothetical protein
MSGLRTHNPGPYTQDFEMSSTDAATTRKSGGGRRLYGTCVHGLAVPYRPTGALRLLEERCVRLTAFVPRPATAEREAADTAAPTTGPDDARSTRSFPVPGHRPLCGAAPAATTCFPPSAASLPGLFTGRRGAVFGGFSGGAWGY